MEDEKRGRKMEKKKEKGRTGKGIRMGRGKVEEEGGWGEKGRRKVTRRHNKFPSPYPTVIFHQCHIIFLLAGQDIQN